MWADVGRWRYINCKIEVRRCVRMNVCVCLFQLVNEIYFYEWTIMNE